MQNDTTNNNFFIDQSNHCRYKVKTHFTVEEASIVARILKICFSNELFDIYDFTQGMNVELEHGARSPKTNVTDDDPLLTGKIALAHLNEFPDYYVRLKKLEEEASAYWHPKF
ncbi:MAG: DUF5661 family protein [Clostridium sp.]|uniref:DUF5661 family protein n=1 Tax=Clostridium sp. TaxID=1506 RepID=UPI003F317019